MKEVAADWLSKQSNKILADYAQLQAQFLDRFVSNEFQDELEPLLRRKQQSTENVQAYADYFQQVLAQMTDPPSAIRVCKIFESQLLSDIRSRMSIRNWENLSELIEEAKLVETKLYLPLMNSPIPVTTQLTEALAYHQKECPSAIYQQLLSEIQSPPFGAGTSRKETQRTEEKTFDIKQYIQSEIETAFKKLNSQVLNTIDKLPGNNIETLQQPFQYPFRNIYYNQPPPTFARPKGECFKCGKPGHHARTCGKWCEFHGRYGHNTEECRDKLSYTSVNSIQQPRCAKIQKTMNHFSSRSSNLNALEENDTMESNSQT